MAGSIPPIPSGKRPLWSSQRDATITFFDLGELVQAIVIHGWRELHLAHLVLDVNGTLTLDGELLPGVRNRISALSPTLTIHLLSADTFGRLADVARSLGVESYRLDGQSSEVEQKAKFVRELGAQGVAAIGNGANDVAMLSTAALGIAVVGPEGSASAAVQAAHVVVMSNEIGLDLLLHPRRSVATLRR